MAIPERRQLYFALPNAFTVGSFYRYLLKRIGESESKRTREVLMSSVPSKSNTPDSTNTKESKSELPDIPSIVNRILRGYRPAAWENDISLNALDDQPFETLPPINTRDESEFKRFHVHVSEPLLNGKSIFEYAANDAFPIPQVVDRERYYPNRDGNYWMSGLGDYLKICQVAEKYQVDINRFFDLGCASGRVLRHFCAQSEIPEIWGSDINSRHIRWLIDHLPNRVKPIFTHCIPTLPLEDNYFDFVSAFSVFTHIDTFESAWISELRRILKPGGIAYLTVHNEDTWNILRGEIDNEENRLIQSVLSVDPNFAQQILEPLPDKRTVYRFQNLGPYRAQVFHSNNYLKKTWGRFMDIKEILPRHHIRQTVVVLQKPLS